MQPLLAPAECGYAAQQRKTLIDVIAWLVVNSLRSEDLQHLQLIRQNLNDVWRSEAYNQVLMSSRPPLVSGDRITEDGEEGGGGAAGGGEVHNADSKALVDALLKKNPGTLVVLDQVMPTYKWSPLLSLPPSMNALQ